MRACWDRRNAIRPPPSSSRRYGAATATQRLVHTKRQVGMPNLKKAKEHAQSLLPHDQVGSLLPLSCPVECFQVFGMGVYVYMRWMLLMKRVFVVAFLFSLANLVQNMTGGLLEEANWMSIHTFGNVARLDASYGASELMVLSTLLFGMFSAVRLVREASYVMKKPDATPGECTVLLQLPTGGRVDTSVIRTAMGAFGYVRHVSEALEIRDVLSRMEARHRLLQQLHAARCEAYLKGHAPDAKLYEKKGGKKSKAYWGQAAKRAALRVKVEGATYRLNEHDEATANLLRTEGPSRAAGTGLVFVTFDDPLAAERAVRTIVDFPPRRPYSMVVWQAPSVPPRMIQKRRHHSCKLYDHRVLAAPPSPPHLRQTHGDGPSSQRCRRRRSSLHACGVATAYPRCVLPSL